MGSSPRSWTDRPDLYGRHQPIDWRTPTTIAERQDIAVARFQHDVAIVVRSHFRDTQRNHHWLADQTEAKPETVRRKLTGETAMTLHDLVSWALAIGIDVIPEYRQRDDLAPPLA